MSRQRHVPVAVAPQLMNEQLANQIRHCPNLPSLPAIAVQVLELARKADVDIAEIARLISKDPALSGKILRTVNSSFYGRGQNVSTISHALVILGLQSVKTLVLGFSLVTHLTKDKPKGFKHLAYWKRSIYAATAARTIANKIALMQQEEAFLGALLQDIGMLVLDRVLGEEYGRIHDAVTAHADLAPAEAKALGSDHAEVGGLLASQWNLPPLLATPIAFHHAPEKVADSILKKVTEVISLAGTCADVFVEDMAAQPLALVRQLLKERYHIPESESNALLDEIGRNTREVASLFEIPLGSAASFEAILNKANEALVEITLRSQQQTSTLERQTQKLERQALTDPLSGLANRWRFDEFLNQHFAAALQSGKPLALVLLDIDCFKSVNDKHGHVAGDRLIQALGKLVATAARATDLAARYGGDEMAIVLPGTTRATASQIADSIRRAIAAKPIVCAAQAVRVTTSVGVAALEPAAPFKEPGHLIKAADLALYAAKHSGRNCVRVFSLKSAAAALHPAA